MTTVQSGSERLRLATLDDYRILDTPPEKSFDDLTALAAAVCKTPIAFLSFIDAKRQWFKSRIGLAVEETPVEVAFCAHAILGSDVFIVPDAHRDLRFEGNPLVFGEPHIRFYASAPLTAPNGSRIGTLGVADTVARTVDATQIQTLRTLASEVIAQLELRKKVDELRVAENRFRALVEHSTDGIAVVGKDGTVTYSKRILGYGEGDVVGHSLFEFVHPDDRDRVWSVIREVSRTPSASLTVECRAHAANGEWRWIEAVLTNLLGEPAIRAVVINYRDITERKEHQFQIEYQAYHDALTNLPNRLLFQHRLTQALAHARRTGSLVAVVFLDLDHFKVINDTFGHSIGDELLKAVAERLAQVLRAEDALSRVGGDEFTLLLQGIATAEAAAAVANKVLHVLQEPFAFGERTLFVTASIGVSLFPTDGDSAEVLIKSADAAMYRAKDAGRNTVELFTAAMNERNRHRLAIESALRRAIERSEFALVYQPIYDCTGKGMVAVEALLRWHDPQRGTIGPDDFISIAEETRLILPIGEWALRTACLQVKQWQQRQPKLRLAINISARQMQFGDLVAMVDRVLAETGFDPSLLELEITESVAMQHVDLTTRILQQLRERGIGIAIDDFGTGQTSLIYLTRFPIDTIKIDRVFIGDLLVDDADTAIVAAVIALSQSLGLRVVAEGVESKEQFGYLCDRRCDGMQGYYLGRPVSPEEMEERI